MTSFSCANDMCNVVRGSNKMAECSCSPDSSTQQRRKKRKKDDLKWEESIDKTNTFEKEQPGDIQNDAINSTQDVEKRCYATNIRSNGKRKLRSRFKTKLKHLGLTDYDPILEINEIENDFKDWSSKHLILGLRSLSELTDDKKQLGKEIFHIINKKEFKKLLPKRLRKYNVRDVKSWCLNEIENSSKDNLLKMLKDDDYDPFVAASSEQKKSTEQTNLPKIDDSIEPIQLSEKDDDDNNASDESTETKDQDKLAHANVEIKTDPELFQEIIKSPDQNDIDELLNEEMPHGSQQKDDDAETAETTCDDNRMQNLAVLEMELRARALKSFIKAQEMKNNITG